MPKTDNSSIDEIDSKYSALIDDRVRRARTEEMTVTLLRRGGIYEVHSSSGGIYEVDIVTEDCTCPDAQNDETPDPCKHVHRVKFELEAERVPLPDGRLPTAPPSEQTKPLGDRRGGGNRSLLAEIQHCEDRIATLESELYVLQFVHDVLDTLASDEEFELKTSLGEEYGPSSQL